MSPLFYKTLSFVTLLIIILFIILPILLAILVTTAVVYLLILFIIFATRYLKKWDKKRKFVSKLIKLRRRHTRGV